METVSRELVQGDAFDIVFEVQRDEDWTSPTLTVEFSFATYPNVTPLTNESGLATFRIRDTDTSDWPVGSHSAGVRLSATDFGPLTVLRLDLTITP